MYRSRLKNNLNDITLEYVSSLFDDAEIAFYDIVGTQAHVIMLYEKKIITKSEAKKILLALEKLKKEKFDKKSDSEDIHELIEQHVIKKIGLESGGKMHTGRSRNDQVSLDIRMKIRDDINLLCHCLLNTIQTLVSLAQKHQKTIMPLYTHLQQAQVGLFSHYLLSYTDALFRDLERLYVTYGRVNESPLGAGPVGGTSIPIDRQSTAKMLGFKGIVENSIDATSTRDYVIEYVAAVAILMTNLSRLAEDFVIWSTSEFAFIELPDEFTSPSSVMPQKKNPDILELTRGKTAQVIGNLTTILSIVKGLPSGYNRDLQQIKPAIWSSSRIAITALIVIKSMLEKINVDNQNIKKAIEGGYLVALDIAEKLVNNGIPFRTAHQIVGNLVKTAHSSKKPLEALSIDEIKRSTKGIDSKQIKKIIDLTSISSSLDNRISQGSSGTSEQKRMIQFRVGKIGAYKTGITKRGNEVKMVFSNLSLKVKNLTK
ncbi:MAG: argininosuccinate lyase [Thaumarchaeota archaeon]|nr:argininosuccinate lyase [Nitrososphaerota archaeon]